MSDSFVSLFHLDERAALTKKPRERLDELISNPNTADAVQALDSIEFYDLYHAVGPGDACCLLEYASPEQLQTCLDLDIWRGDEMRDDELAPWVEAMLDLPDEKFGEFWHDLDPELMALYLHRNVHLYLAEDKNDDVDIPEDESPNVAQSPDFTYWIAYPEDPEKADLLRRLIDRLYVVLGIEKTWSTLAGMNFEMETDLEETAYRFRTERIREYGFMPRAEAAAIFANVDVVKAAEKMRSEAKSDLYVGSYSATSRLDNALAQLDHSAAAGCYFERILAKVADRESIRNQLLAAAQQIATYDGYQPHEMQGFEESMLVAVGYISVGLEYAAMKDDDLAARILSGIALKRILTLGFSLTLELQRKAKILVSRGHLSIIEDQKMSLLTTEQRDCVEGMLKDRPRPSASCLTPFVSLGDVQKCAMVIADVATRELFFGEALHKTRDDISMVAYTHELVQGVENVNFDNVAITWLTRHYLRLEEPWNVFMTDELPKRADVLEAVSLDRILALFRSSLPESSKDAMARFAAQLRDYVVGEWPENVQKPDVRLMKALVIAERDE
ncbi:MAG: hypothetical protein IJU23_00180 [Proteobacteria bacterium]|nr:hypothetical protein [Pseudomonadota bacterium]